MTNWNQVSTESERFRSHAPSGDAKNHQRFLPLLAGLAYFGFLLAISLTFHSVPGYGVETDFLGRFVPAARSFAAGSLPIDDFHGPLYPIVLSLVHAVVRDYMVAGQIINALSTTLFTMLSFFLFKRWFSSGLAIIGAALVASSPHLVESTYSCGNDMLFVALVGSALYFYITRSTRSWLNLGAVATLLALSYLVRFTGILILGGFVASILFVNVHDSEWKGRITRSMVLIAVFVAVIAPCGIYCLAEKGEFFYSKHYKNLAWTFVAQGEVEWEEFWSDDWSEAHGITGLTDVVAVDVSQFARTYVANFFGNVVRDLENLVGWPIAIAAMIGSGLVLTGAIPLTREQTAFCVVSLSHFAAMALVVYSPRFTLFLVPFYTMFALQGLSGLQRAGTGWPHRAALILGGVLVVGSAGRAWSYNEAQIGNGPRELLEVRNWFTANEPHPGPGATVSARKPHIAYFTGLEFCRLPRTGSLAEFLSLTEASDVDYVYFSTVGYRLHPELRALIDDPVSVSSRLELILVQPIEDSNLSACLYRVRR